MLASDPRGDGLHTFETCAWDFARRLAGRLEVGEGVASRDIDRLSAFAAKLSQAILSWRVALADLEAGAVEPIDPKVAARRLVESVFDDLLIPEASRLLSAALDLVWMGV